MRVPVQTAEWFVFAEEAFAMVVQALVAGS